MEAQNRSKRFQFSVWC